MERTLVAIQLARRASALIRHFALFAALVGASAVFAGECETHLESPLLRATRYFSYEALMLKDESGLRAMQTGLEPLLKVVRAYKDAATARLVRDHSLANSNARTRLEQDERNIAQINGAISRRLAQLQAKASVAPTIVAIYDVNVTGRTANEVLNQIGALTKHLGAGLEHHVYRYFEGAREDLMREHGTDLYGREFGSSEAYDQFGLEATLMELGLKPEDGFYGVDYANAIYMGTNAKGETYPFPLIDDFMAGDRALAIYDLRALDCTMADFWVFADPPAKKKALLAIVRPRR